MFNHELPVIESVVATWQAIFREGIVLLVAVAIPALAISVIEFVSLEFPRQFPYTLIFWLLSAPFLVLFAVVCHRSIILGGASLPNRLGLSWSARETRFLGWTIAIIVVTWFLAWLFRFLAVIVALILPAGIWLAAFSILLLLGYLYVRLAMVLPATAVEDDTSFDRAWSLTGGNGLRVLGVIVLAAAPVLAAIIVLGLVLSGRPDLWIIFELAHHALGLVGICALSVSYRELLGMENSLEPE